MDNLTKGILGTTVGVGSLAMLKDSTKMLSSKKPMKTGKLVGNMSKIMVGTGILDATSSMIK